MKTIVGLGEVLWDMLPQGKQLGGAPINFAYHASCFGHQTYAVSAVGRDDLGQLLIDQLSHKSIKLVIPSVAYPTGTVQIALDDKGIPQYNICQQVAWDFIPFTHQIEQLAQQTNAVCFGSLAQRNEVSRKTIQHFLKAMPNGNDTLKIFDVNLRQQFYNYEVLHQSLQLCNVLKINDEELPLVAHLLSLAGSSAEKWCFELLDKYSLRMVIYTCGTKGSSIYTASNDISFADTPCVKVKDTVGAGDSFTGAFVGALLNGKSINEAHQIAVKVSAYVCTQQGAMPDIPANLLECIHI